MSPNVRHGRLVSRAASEGPQRPNPFWSENAMMEYNLRQQRPDDLPPMTGESGGVSGICRRERPRSRTPMARRVGQEEDRVAPDAGSSRLELKPEMPPRNGGADNDKPLDELERELERDAHDAEGTKQQVDAADPSAISRKRLICSIGHVLGCGDRGNYADGRGGSARLSKGAADDVQGGHG